MPTEPLTTDATTTPHPANPRGETAFVIDDDALMANLVARHLERRGIAGARWEDPRRLLEALAEARPDYLFTDLEMPLMRGAELAASARARGYRGTIVIVTASRDHAALVDAIRKGADEILPKPPRDADLELVIERARARSRRALPALDELESVLERLGQGAILLDEELVPFYANPRSREILRIAAARDAAPLLERGNLASRAAQPRAGDDAVIFIDVAKPGEAPGRLLVGFETHECRVAGARTLRLVLMHDFSEWRRLDELHSRFAATLSHRMRTPLTSARNAVRILSGPGEPLGAAEKERFLDIGCRNIEKLISSFDDLQKLFMMESGEINACRSLFRAGREIERVLAEARGSGRVAAFEVRGGDGALFTSAARLREYVLAAVETMAGWLGEAPVLACSIIASERGRDPAEEPALAISIAHEGRAPEGRGALPAYVSLRELEKGHPLERLACTLDGALSIDRAAIRLRLPADPPFDRDRDLVHPLHLALERSTLDGAPCHVLSVRLAGAPPDPEPFVTLFEGHLCALLGGEGWRVARGERPGRYAVFAIGETAARVAETMERLAERFSRCCRERGDELYPTVRWDVTYARDAREPVELPLVDSAV